MNVPDAHFDMTPRAQQVTFSLCKSRCLPDPSPTPAPVSGLVEAGTRTTVLVKANAFDSRTSDTGCAPIGCVAVNTRDSSLSSRWSCKGDLLDGESCEITFNFEEPQEIVRMDIAFYNGTERTRLLEVEVNGSKNSEIESSGTTDGLENFELDADEVETLTLTSLGLAGNEWISVTEVRLKAWRRTPIRATL